MGHQYSSGRPFEVVQEGQETEHFWNVLGGKADYPKASKVEYATVEPRLFILSDISGSLKAEEINSFSQTDLVHDDVALLDAYYELFLWIGPGANENEKKLVEESAKKYLESAKDGRNANDCTVCTIFAGRETLNFTKYFKGWDWHLSELNDYKDPYVAMKEKYSKKAAPVEEQKVEGKFYYYKIYFYIFFTIHLSVKLYVGFLFIIHYSCSFIIFINSNLYILFLINRETKGSII